MKKMPTEYKDSVVGGGTVVNFMFDGNTDIDLSKLSQSQQDGKINKHLAVPPVVRDRKFTADPREQQHEELRMQRSHAKTATR